uniref:Uncharacterized protein n=1 Tax=viral metagenome TaxID=1070528 RepID=A0A6C0LBS5_9ZZZZ
MFYKRRKVVHLNLKNANTTKDQKDAKAVNAAKAVNDIKEPKEDHILRLKFEKNMRKLFGINTMYNKNKI